MKIDWISPNNYKPEAEHEMLLLCSTKIGHHLYKCIGFYVPPRTLRDDSNFCWDYE